MANDLVQIQYRYFRTEDGGARQEIWCKGRLLAEHPVWGYNWASLYGLYRPQPWIPPFYPWDDECMETALVRQGSCSLALYNGGKV